MSYRPYRPRRSPAAKIFLLLIAVFIAAGIYAFVIRDDSTASGNPPSGVSHSKPAGPDAGTTQPQELPWELALVNESHPLPENYLVATNTLTNGLECDHRIYSPLMEMLSDCEAAGLQPLVCSAYRTVDKQTELFENKVNSYLSDGLSYDEAYAATAAEIAIPGTSEHNQGLAVDICALSYQILDETQQETPEQQWLMAHCQDYGFILRYPPEKSDITGIIYEPWHYRYVGKEAAQSIMASGLCLEEWLEENYQYK